MSPRSVILQADGTTVTVKVDENGKWARIDGDWQSVDDVLDALLGNLSDGTMIATQRDDGQFMFKLTAEGQAKTEDMIHSNPEAASFYAEVARAHEQRPDLTPAAERVLVALADGEADDPEGLVEVTGLTRGQVMQALALLVELGFAEPPE